MAFLTLGDVRDKVIRADNGCWVWVGARYKDGYGQKTIRPKQYRAHRLMWELVRGPIPEGMHILHHCDNPPCINPDHLFLGDQYINNADKMAKNRQRNGKMANPPTHCIHGHEFTEANTYRPPKRPNSRICATCKRERQRIYDARDRLPLPDAPPTGGSRATYAS